MCETIRLQRVLVCLDGSAYSESAISSAIRRIKVTGGLLVGISVVDIPGIDNSVNNAGLNELQKMDTLENAKNEAEGLLTNFANRCKEEGVQYECLKKIGTPNHEILEEAKFADLIFCGVKTFFHFDRDEGDIDTLEILLKQPACPVIAVPDFYEEAKNIIIAYDGSYNSTHTLKSYIYLSAKLSEECKFHLVNVTDEPAKGEQLLNMAEKYLNFHKVKVEKIILQGSPSEELHDLAHSLKPSFLVLGASSKGFLASLFRGSVVKKILANPEIPTFFYV
ncbi:universal stress protein [Candidatus Riflebacteria bacterium]